ncbi:EAL domain-containing protein [Shewanella avicenniae]|uniref:EAL domain-containing protein n=1 Tax=Shewanella avicenniae TaxID=2814294 RepID=A0ABX7QR56_9GAMM|nr:EAL domain-containing protein [Shewanella avicenniae]QSX33188.1 EAL domain-containing protein [Shewanella avicenniae]
MRNRLDKLTLNLSQMFQEYRAPWVLLYGLISILVASFFAHPNALAVIDPAGAMVVAVMLMLPRPMVKDGFFIFGILILSLLLNLTLYQHRLADAVILSLSYWLQGMVGFFLFRIFHWESQNFERMEVAFNFLFLGCVVPSALLAFLPAVVLPSETVVFSLQWGYWFSNLALSSVLFSSLILLMRVTNRKPAVSNYLNLLLWCLAIGLILAVFNDSWIREHGVPPESFIFVPMFGFFAVKFSLRFNAWMLVSSALLTVYQFEQVQITLLRAKGVHNYLLLALLILSIHSLNLLISSLLSERYRTFNRMRRSKRMYEALSAINQEMVGDNFSEAEVFEKVCRIVTHKIGLEQTSIAVCSFDEQNQLEQREAKVSQLYIYPANKCIETGLSLVVDPQRLTEHSGFQSFNNAQICRNCDHSCSYKQIYAFPIYKQGKLYAVLTVFDSTAFVFDEAVTALFEKLVKTISFALNALESRQQLKLINEVFECGQESIVITDLHGQIIKVNPAFCRITGYSLEEVIGKNPRMLRSGRQDDAFYEKLWRQLQQHGHWSGEFWNKKKNGELYIQRGTISEVRNELGEAEHFIAVMEDTTAQWHATENARRLANFDTLTGLANRNSLKQQFGDVVEQVHERGKQLAVLFIDLDDFKHVNDAMGHQFGDEVLKAVALRLQRLLTPIEWLFRFSGDEFLLLSQYDSASTVEQAERLINAISSPFNIGQQTVNIGCSIGIAISGTDGATLDQIVGNADAAMYRAKAAGRATYAFFSAEMQTQAMAKFRLKYDLARAIENNEFVLHYQPKVRIFDNVVVGAEALVRWYHPERGAISPAEFIPQAEESGQIVQIDRWVLCAVVTQLGEWCRQGFDVKPIALNMSLPMFQRPQFVEELQYLLQSYQVPAALVELEITERVAMGDLEYTVSTLRALKALGVSIAIDDFGTGYSSMSYLFDFPIDTLKIDRAFVTDIDTDAKKQGIVNAIISLSNTMELTTVAEGIESEAEKQYLLMFGCDFYQGFHFSKPVPAALFAERYFRASNVVKLANGDN